MKRQSELEAFKKMLERTGTVFTEEAAEYHKIGLHKDAATILVVKQTKDGIGYMDAYSVWLFSTNGTLIGTGACER